VYTECGIKKRDITGVQAKGVESSAALVVDDD